MKDERLLKTVILGMVTDLTEDQQDGPMTADWCGCALPEAAQLALDRRKWRKNQRHMSSQEVDYPHESLLR